MNLRLSKGLKAILNRQCRDFLLPNFILFFNQYIWSSSRILVKCNFFSFWGKTSIVHNLRFDDLIAIHQRSTLILILRFVWYHILYSNVVDVTIIYSYLKLHFSIEHGIFGCIISLWSTLITKQFLFLNCIWILF